MACTAIGDSPVEMRNIREDALAAFDVKCESLAKKKRGGFKTPYGMLACALINECRVASEM